MRKSFSPFFLALAALITSTSLVAQDLDVDIGSDGISISTQQWYENPIVWGGAVLLIIVLVLVSRTKKA